MRISRLEYRSLAVDGALPPGRFIEVDGLYRVSAPAGVDGLNGDMADPAHWAVCLFPRDAQGNVVGWFMAFDSRAALVDALKGRYLCKRNLVVAIADVWVPSHRALTTGIPFFAQRFP
jgi:hypothetical protein